MIRQTAGRDASVAEVIEAGGWLKAGVQGALRYGDGSTVQTFEHIQWFEDMQWCAVIEIRCVSSDGSESSLGGPA